MTRIKHYIMAAFALMISLAYAPTASATLVSDATDALAEQTTSAETLAIAALAIVAVLALFALVKRLLFAR
jgi:hypothetical protein